MDAGNVWALVAIALFNAITAVATLMTQNEMRTTRKNMVLLEQNTNSLMAQLVATTKSEAHAAGMKEEKDKKP